MIIFSVRLGQSTMYEEQSRYRCFGCKNIPPERSYVYNRQNAYVIVEFATYTSLYTGKNSTVVFLKLYFEKR